MKNRILAYGLSAAMLLTCAPVVAKKEAGPDQWKWAKPSALTAIMFGAAALPIFLLHLRKPDKNFKSRFDSKKLKSNPFSKEALEQLWYLFYDEFIGQKSETRKVKADKEDGSLIVSEGAEPHGVLGNGNDLFKPAENTAKTLAALYLGYLFAMKPDALWAWIKPKDSKPFDDVSHDDLGGKDDTNKKQKKSSDVNNGGDKKEESQHEESEETELVSTPNKSSSSTITPENNESAYTASQEGESSLAKGLKNIGSKAKQAMSRKKAKDAAPTES